MRLFVVLLGALTLCSAGCGAAKPASGGKQVRQLLKELQDPEAKARKNAVFMLEAIGTTDPQVLAALIGMLKDDDAAVRCEAIVAVAKWGDAAKEAMPELAQMRRDDPSPEVQEYAAKALNKFGAGPRPDQQ